MPDGLSRNPFTNAEQTTLSNVLARIEVDEGLSLQRRRNLCSAIRALAKLMGKNLGYLPAHPGYYRDFLKGLHPEHCGLTASRIRNVKSDVLFALRHVGCIQGARTYMAPLSVEWQALWDAAVCAGRLRAYASRLMHFASAQGISPAEVDDDVSERFRAALDEESFVKNPIRTWKGILRTWNKLVDIVPGWPRLKLSIPNGRDDYSIPLGRFPKPLRDEIDALVSHWSGKDLLDDTCPNKLLKPRTIKSRLYRLRQIASALVLRDREIGDIDSLAKIIEVDAAKTALRFYLDRSGGKLTSQIHGLAILIKTIAKHWIRVDAAHLDALQDLCRRVDPNIKGMTDKNRDRLRQFNDPKNVRLLLDFPARRFEAAIAKDRERRRDAIAVQIALAVEILLMAPMRAANLVNLNIDRHIQRSRTGRNGVVHLVIPRDEVKNDEDLEFPLPSETVRLLDLYLRDFHPRLVTGPCPWLFPGENGEPKTINCLGEQIKEHVFKATGLKVNLHLFRHIAAKFYLDSNPGGYEVCRRILAHRSMETTTKFYAGMETVAASRHFDEQILKLRRSLVGGRT